jgi:hypothetical protein
MDKRMFDLASEMTLRQWYAGQALAGFCANVIMNQHSPNLIATIALEQADAMIEAEGKDAND